jgi:retron-type reverse transcriptase
MREAYIRTRKDGATGIDGVTAQDYEANLEANLRGLLERIKSGRYKAPPVRRTYIPKAEAVYEQDFLSCSYGFRPGRHNATTGQEANQNGGVYTDQRLNRSKLGKACGRKPRLQTGPGKSGRRGL